MATYTLKVTESRDHLQSLYITFKHTRVCHITCFLDHTFVIQHMHCFNFLRFAYQLLSTFIV